MNKTFNKLPFCCALVSILGIASQAIKANSTYQLNRIVDDLGNEIPEWIEHNRAFTIMLDVQDDLENTQQENFKITPQFEVMLGDHDVSSMFIYKNGQLQYLGRTPLPHGEHLLQISFKSTDSIIFVGEASLNILSPSGFKQASWTPRLELNVNSQLDESELGDSPPSEDPRFTQANANFGITSHHENDQLAVSSSFNFFATTEQEEAVQFASKANNADKIDLTDYQVDVSLGNHQLSLGHTSYGSNPLLIDSLSRRGVSWSYENESSLSFSGAMLSGVDLTGIDNFTGLSDYQKEYVNALGFGVNALTDARISLRVEGFIMEAVKSSASDFGLGEISSAEENRGVGFKVITNDAQGKLSAELTIALSQYTNPDDDSLDFGDDLVELETEEAIAHNFIFSYQLFDDWQLPWGSIAGLTLSGSHYKAEPFYQTLTAYIQANVETKQLGGQYQLGDVSGAFSSQSSQDNLDNIVTILTTRTESDVFNASFPLMQILQGDDEEANSPWLPNIDYAFQSVHQFAINAPDEALSGFNDNSHLPDQFTKSHSLSTSWQIEQHSLALQSNYSDQDNRQIGRDTADFSNLQHALTFNYTQSEATQWSFSIGRNRQLDKELNKIQYSNSFNLSYNWQSQSGLSINANYGVSKDEDSLEESENTSTTADFGVVKRLARGEWWLPAEGSLSFRVTYNDSESIDRVFDQMSRFGNTVALLGFNLSFQ
ncbi:hypothetical protein FLL45_08245 [Aliikangiella marina]|uniref:TIGR03016 family PEP-CTERM system-associated outer membrane protein n=1 Tax=Aliikangiella marina TaxID=1712262 RepID=A0A545TCK9_9GAMM|nr:hypothetical protein [Aliikangiella marina]TQV74939.1 hypothetical protein FLL45_08245 [Aliikangiella marina]